MNIYITQQRFALQPDVCAKPEDDMVKDQLKSYSRDMDLLPWLRQQGLVAGGEASQKWLAENGFRDSDGHPNARKAWEFVAKCLGIEWELKAGKHGHYIEWDKYPRILGPSGEMMQPSLADLVRHCRGDITLNFVPHTRDEHERHMLPLLMQGEAGVQLSEFVRRHGHKPPKGRVLNALGSWLKRALQGEESTAHFFVCPDWATECGHYTFSGVGCGVGLVASRALEIMPEFYQLSQRIGIRVNFVVAIGDFEGDSESVCSRLGIDAPEFRRRCRLSQEAFQRELESRCPEMVRYCAFPFATELAGGMEQWRLGLQYARECVGQGVASAMQLTDKQVSEIVNARRSLYERWHGANCDAQAILADQLPEYGAMGMVARKSPNPLIIGVDHAVMAHGWQVGAEEPVAVLYMRHSDY